VKLAALLLCALIVVGCGEKKGTYAKFDDDVTAKGWEVWRDPARKVLYLRSVHGWGYDVHTYSCADDEARLAVRIEGRAIEGEPRFERATGVASATRAAIPFGAGALA
jgi:hypothetical protein